MDSLFSLLFSVIGKWYIWLPIVLVLGYFAVRNNRRAKTILETEHVLLILEIPRANDKQELAAEQMFASLHGILKSKRELAEQGGLQEHISFEIAAIDKQIRFYVWVPTHLQNFVEGQIYAQYPTVQIHKADSDYAAGEITQSVQHTAEMTLIDNDVIPIKTFQNFEVDPLAAITATLAKLDEHDEEVWIQVLARPIPDDWHRKSTKYISHLKGGKSNLATMFAQYFTLLAKPLEPGSTSGAKELSERDKGRVAEVEKKSNKLGYQVKIRIAYLGNDATTAKLRMQAIVGTFKQFNSTNLNGFQVKNATFAPEGIAQYKARFFIDKGYILNIEELASVFHFPHTNVETPNIVWTTSKTAEPPTNLPVITGTDADNEISAFGLTNFRGHNQQFGIYRADRGRHIYIIGQTGTGKSGLLELLALSDVFHNHGYAIIDPHGDFAINNMRFIPASRVQDVVYFNPSDTAFPMGFNPMEVTDPNMKSNISSEIIGVFKRLFGDSWGPRLEYILRFTILALLEYPNCTMLDIPRMLTDKKFRKEVLSHVTDAVVLQFWNVEFAGWTDKFASEAIAPVLNKVGAFTANPVIRNIIGQPVSTFNIRQLMDEGKILIVNLSKGLIGEDNASILGSFLVTKIQLAAMSRSDIPRIEDRRPFYLYVDEFQNFATDSFATILSEARKYALNLTVANQYVSQMQESVRDAVFGNVGTMISLRVSADDAPILSKPFAPQFEPDDLMQMSSRHFITSMIINGQKVPAFSATTLNLPSAQTDYTDYIVQNTRHHFARPRQQVEQEINELIGGKPTQQSGSSNNASKPSQPQQPKVQTTTAPQQQKPAQATAAPQTPSEATPQQQNSPAATNTDATKRKRRRRKRGGGGGSDQGSNDNRSNDRPSSQQQSQSSTQNSSSQTVPRQDNATPTPPAPRSDAFESGNEIRLR